MNWMLSGIGQRIADYLERAEQGYEPFTPSDPDALRATLRPGDVLLVEGNNHVSGVIKYLTQSTWSHAALYVGPIGERETAAGEPLVLVEAVLGQGVVGSPLSKYAPTFTPASAVRSGSSRTTVPGSAPMRPSASASTMTSRTSSTCCATCCRCRCRSAGAGA